MDMYQEAQKHFKECNGCEHCVWYEESAYNISEHYTRINIPKFKQKTFEYNYNKNDHPLLKGFVEKFKGEIL